MKNYKHKILKLVTLCFALSFTHCTPKASTRKRSFADDNYNTELIQQISQERSGIVNQLEALMLKAEFVVESQSSLERKNVDQQLLMKKVITPLRPYVLNLDFMMDPSNRFLVTKTGIPVVAHLVRAFNSALILIYNSSPQLIISQTDLLQKYKDQIFWDCNQELKGSCGFIKYYKDIDSNQIVRIVKMIHDLESNSDEKLRLIKAAIDLKNRRLDANLRFMLLERLSESFKGLNESNVDYELRRDSDLFANILKIQIDNRDPQLFYKKLIATINPWTLSRKSDDPKNPAMSELIGLGGQYLIYDKDNKLTDSLKKAIAESRCALAPGYEQGIQFQFENIQGLWKKRMEEKDFSSIPQHCNHVMAQLSNNSEVDAFGSEAESILKKLVADVDFTHSDEYDYLAHQVYFGHYNMEDGDAFWQYTHKDQEKFLAAIMRLVKMQVVHTIVFTNNRMNQFYNDNPNSKLIELLSESDREASRIRKAWSIIIDRVKLIKNFAGRVINKAPQEAKDHYQSLKAISLSLEKNIKFYVTYPNMIPLLHYMATLDLVETFQSFFGPVTIDSNAVILGYFSGKFNPWFNFGNDGVPLDQVELMYAFYFTIMTDTFETYSTNKKVKFSFEDFFNIAIKKILFKNEDYLRKQIDQLQKIEEKSVNNLNAIKEMCSEEMNLRQNLSYDLNDRDFDWRQDYLNEIKSQPRQKNINIIPFHNLGSTIYDGTSSDKGRAGEYIADLFSTDATNVFERMQSVFHEQNAQALILMEIYQKYVGDKIGLKNVVKKQFAEFERLKAKYAKLYFSLADQVKGCNWVFYQREQDIRAAIIFKEAQYWGQTFDQLVGFLEKLSLEERKQLLIEKSVEEFNDNDREFQSVKEQILYFTKNPEPPAKANYPEEYSQQLGFTKITDQRVTTYKMDAYTRLVSHYQELFPGQYSIEYPANYQKLEHGIYEKSEPISIDLNWKLIASNKELARENFIRAGVQSFANKVQWVDTLSWPLELDRDLSFLITLYKLDRIALDSDIDCYDPEIKKNKQLFQQSCRQVSAKEVINVYNKIITTLNINARDDEILNLLGKKHKIIDTVYDRYIKRDNEQRLYSYYDTLLKRIISDGLVENSPQTWFQPYLTSFSKSMNQMKATHLLFPFDDGVESIFVKRYSNWINIYFNKIEDFLMEIQKLPKLKPFEFKYHRDYSFPLGVARSSGAFEPFIQGIEYNKFINHIDGMNNESNQYFKTLLMEKKKEFRSMNTSSND